MSDDIYQAGAEALWGTGGRSSASPMMGGAVGEKAGWQAKEITENLIQLKNKVNANSSKFPRDYTDALQSFINSWQTFVNSVSGRNIPWYDVGRQFTSSFTAWYNRAEIYNKVQQFGAQYKKLWDLASIKLGAPATPNAPPAVNKPISESPVADTIASAVKGLLIVGGLGVGAYVLVNLMSAPKRREVVVVPEVEEHE